MIAINIAHYKRRRVSGHGSPSSPPNTTVDSVFSQRVKSPRFSGAMTRRAHSFKRNPSIATNKDINANNGSSQSNNDGGSSGGFSTQYKIDLQMNSPTSEIGGNSGSADGFDSVMERKQSSHVTQRVAVRGFLRKPIESVAVKMGLRERKKLGHWMFFAFCGVCLFLGILKICATGSGGSRIRNGGGNF